MRLTRFIDDRGHTHFGSDQGDGSAERLTDSPLLATPEPTGDIRPIARRLAPIDPPNILCIGLNYAAHAAEGGVELPTHPCLFMKPTTTLNHPDAPVLIPRSTHGPELDYEAELAVVIGKTARDVPEEQALDYILGYTCGNDISARWWQKQGGGGQFVRGKGFDTFCPLGPVIVTQASPNQPNSPDAITDPQNLRIRSILNGTVMQDDSTAGMIFPVAELIARISRDTTLLPGTVILTGTPSGVGQARNPPVFLKPGDRITIDIEHLGQLTNPVAQAR